MIKYFRKIEKVINLIAVIAIIVVLVMVVLWFIGYSRAYYQELVPFIAFAAFVFFGYKVIILILSYYYQTEISKIASKLDAKRQKDDDHSKKENGEKIEMNLLLTHAEDQLMSAEAFGILAEKFIRLYKGLK